MIEIAVHIPARTYMLSNRGDIQDIIDRVLEFLPKLKDVGVAILLVIAAWFLSNWAARVVRRTMERRKADPEIAVLLRMLTRWGIFVLGVVVALEQVTDSLGALIAGLGVVGFTIGFALQDVAKNFVAGILLLVQQPFEIGDSIEVAGFGGKVLSISLRTTELRTFDGRHVLIPNGDVYVSPIVNFSRALRRRIELKVGVAYDMDLDQVAGVTLEALRGIPGVLEDPAPQVVFDKFGDSALEFTAYYWVDTESSEVLEGRDAGVKAIKEAFERGEIESPYPTVTVLMPER